MSFKEKLITAGFILIMFELALIGYATNCNGQDITRKYKDNQRIRIDTVRAPGLHSCDVFFPGGGFVTQNWAVDNTWATYSKQSNRVTCKVGYPTSFFPSISAANKGIEYSMIAIRYIIAHATEFRIDVDSIYLWGTSAGGFCAMGVYQYPDVKVAGVINGWGGVLNLSYLSQNKIPVFNISTDIDKTVPVDCGNAFGVPCCGSKAIYTELQLQGVKTDWLVFEGYKHGLVPKDLQYNDRIKLCWQNAIQFFK